MSSLELGSLAFSEERQKRGQVDCTIVVVTYNNVNEIASLLDSLPSAVGPRTIRIVVVDNASADDTLELVRDRYPGVICVAAGANLGYAAGINVGRKYAGGCSALLVLNPDIELEPGSVQTMLSVLDEPGVGIVVPMLLDASGRRRTSLRRQPTLARALGDALLGDHFGWRPGWLSEIVRAEQDYTTRHSVDWATGAAMLISKDCDRLVGSWDERFFLYSEEVDYAARARAAGFRIEYIPEARVRHSGSGSGRSDALVALKAVNRIRYAEKLGYRTRAFRVIVITHELLRVINSGHRTALCAVARRSSWSALVTALRGPVAGVEAK